MRHNVKRYLHLGRSDRALLAHAFISIAIMDLALRFFSLENLSRRSAGISGETAIRPEGLHYAQRCAHWIEVASRHHVVRAQCLHRSLVLHHWLRRKGFPSELMIGVRKEGSVLKAHAWVELGGHVINDTFDSVTLFTLLAPSHLHSISASQIEGPWPQPTMTKDTKNNHG